MASITAKVSARCFARMSLIANAVAIRSKSLASIQAAACSTIEALSSISIGSSLARIAHPGRPVSKTRRPPRRSQARRPRSTRNCSNLRQRGCAELQQLAPAADCRQDRLQVCRHQQEHHERRRFFDRLEQCFLRIRHQQLRIVDDHEAPVTVHRTQRSLCGYRARGFDRECRALAAAFVPSRVLSLERIVRDVRVDVPQHLAAATAFETWISLDVDVRRVVLVQTGSRVFAFPVMGLRSGERHVEVGDGWPRSRSFSTDWRFPQNRHPLWLMMRPAS